MIGTLTFDDTTTVILETIADMNVYLAVALAPFQFFIILTQSNNLGGFKWLILNHSFWCLLLSFSGIAIKPVMLGGFSAYYCDGYIKNTSSSIAVIAIQVFQCFAMMAGGGVIMTVNFRYFGLYPGRIKDICYSAKSAAFWIAVHLLFIFICINGCYQILKIPYEVRLERALNASLELEPYTKLQTFVFIPYETTNVNLMVLAIVQIIVTILFVLMPFGWMAFYLLFQIKIGGRIMLLCEAFVASHAFVEYVTTLYVVLPYRRYIIRKYRFIRNKISPKSDGVIVFTAHYSSQNFSHSQTRPHDRSHSLRNSDMC
ncbi:hypothetical protein FO519_003221 [Halicephalobus sp. NKZ332]|nr:hypothetical protein FO519_003221 [Halicephalobus sp. NKZ332]